MVKVVLVAGCQCDEAFDADMDQSVQSQCPGIDPELITHLFLIILNVQKVCSEWPLRMRIVLSHSITSMTDRSKQVGFHAQIMRKEIWLLAINNHKTLRLY